MVIFMIKICWLFALLMFDILIYDKNIGFDEIIDLGIVPRSRDNLIRRNSVGLSFFIPGVVPPKKHQNAMLGKK